MKTRYAIRIFSLLLLTVLAIGQSRTRTYTIVPSESSFWVFAGKTGLFSAAAHDHEIGVKSFSGRVVVPAAGASGGSLEMEVDAPSLVVLDKKPSEEDKKKIFNSMHNEVLESAKYQKITFKSVSVSDVKQTGNDEANRGSGRGDRHATTAPRHRQIYAQTDRLRHQALFGGSRNDKGEG